MSEQSVSISILDLKVSLQIHFRILIGKNEVDKVNRILTSRAKEMLKNKIRSQMKLTAAQLQSVINKFVDKKSQLEILNHLRF